MPLTKTFWYDERLAQSVLRLLYEKPTTTEEVASQLGIDEVDALQMLREMSADSRVLDVTTFADREVGKRIWVSAETPLRTS